VAKYVNIDGMSSTEPPGGVPTLSIIAGLGLGGEVGGAINVTIPGQTHVQVASSPESFYYMYQFFTGMEPATTDVIPQPRGQVRVAGRAVLFPQNVGVEGAMLQMWEVEAATGQRARKKPAASCVLGEDGSWGPWKAKGGSSYEFVILREGARPHHFYSEPLIRSDYLMRLNTSPPGGGVGAYLATGDGSTNLVLTRDKEFWANVPGNSDVLEVGGTTLVGEAACPIGTSKVGIFIYDAPASIPPIPGTPDGISNITVPTWLHSIAFLTGIDFVVPAAIPPDSSVTVELMPRGGGPSQVVNCPNFASSEHAVSIRFNDFSQEINTWPEYKMAR
jgi:hypothetical protein